jgi:hypothetical protein
MLSSSKLYKHTEPRQGEFGFFVPFDSQFWLVLDDSNEVEILGIIVSVSSDPGKSFNFVDSSADDIAAICIPVAQVLLSFLPNNISMSNGSRSFPFRMSSGQSSRGRRTLQHIGQ